MKNNTEDNFVFQIEGEDFSSSKQILTAREIINLAKEKGLPTSNLPIEDLTLKTEQNIYSGDDPVDLSKEKNFSLGIKIYKFKVNGQELESKFEKLIALDIIKMAKEKGIPLPGDKPDDFLLETRGGKNKFKLDEWVDLGQFHEFLIILDKPTPVA